MMKNMHNHYTGGIDCQPILGSLHKFLLNNISHNLIQRSVILENKSILNQYKV